MIIHVFFLVLSFSRWPAFSVGLHFKSIADESVEIDFSGMSQTLRVGCYELQRVVSLTAVCQLLILSLVSGTS